MAICDMSETGGSLAPKNTHTRSTSTFQVSDRQENSILELPLDLDDLPAILENSTDRENLSSYSYDQLKACNGISSIGCIFWIYHERRRWQSPSDCMICLNTLWMLHVAYSIVFHELFSFFPSPSDKNENKAAYNYR